MEPCSQLVFVHRFNDIRSFINANYHHLHVCLFAAVEQTAYILNTPVIVLITLGIPMILLALLLLLRYQR